VERREGVKRPELRSEGSHQGGEKEHHEFLEGRREEKGGSRKEGEMLMGRR